MGNHFNFWNSFVWLRITDEGSLPDMRIWSILWIKSALKLCIHLSKSPFWYVIKHSETAFSNSNVKYFWSIKNSSEFIEKFRLRNFQGSQVSSFDFSTLYTSLPHDLIKAKVLSPVKFCFNREPKTYLCTSDKAEFFSNKKYDSYACWTFTELCEACTFLMENIYVQFDGMVYQQIMGIPMGTNCVTFIADLFLYYLCQTSRNPNGLTS